VTPLTVTVLTVGVAGLLIGLTLRQAVRRDGSTSAEANRGQLRLLSLAMLAGAAALLVIACTEESDRRYLNFGVATAMVSVAAWQLARNRRR
jgi:hypothetical protein